MAENNAKNYEGGTKGLGSVKTDVVSPALQKLTELSVKHQKTVPFFPDAMISSRLSVAVSTERVSNSGSFHEPES